MTGLAAGSLVMTADGALPVEYLAAGDRVVTRAGMVRVADVQVSAGLADVVDVTASALGHGRPAETATLAADQPVRLSDWRAKTLFGAPQAVVPVGRLVDGQLLRRRRAEVRLYTLILDRPAVMQACGMELACDGVTVPA